MKSWSGLDYVVVCMVAVSVVASFFKGFVRELISLGAAIWGVLLACWFYSSVAPLLAPYMPAPYVKRPEIASLAAFVIIFVVALLAGAVASSLAARLVKKAGLQWFDRLLGASFGLVRGLLVSLAIVLALVVFPPGTEAVERSQLAPYLVYGAKALAAAAPAEMRARFGAGLQRAQRIWNQRVPL